MEDYKLHIEDSAGTWRIADFGTNKPAMNYQLNNLAELKDRQIDYSRALKLPFTPINCAIFGYANEFDVVTDIPYRKLNCRLFCNDSILAGPGSYLILDQVTDNFEVQILSGNADFFEQMKAVKMSNVDYGHIQHYITPVINTNVQTNSVFYGVAEFSKSANPLTVQGSYFYTKYALPFAKLKALVEYLLSDYMNGYTLTTDVPLSFYEEALRIGNYQRDNTSFQPYNKFTTYSQQLQLNSGQTSSVTINSAMIFSQGGAKYKFKSPHDLTFFANTVFRFTSNTFTQLLLTVRLDGQIVSSFNITSGNGVAIDHYDGSQITIDNEQMPIVLNQGEEYELEFTLTNQTLSSVTIVYTTETTTSETNYTNTDNQEVPIGGLIPVAKNLGFDTAFDVVKFFFQLYGLVPYVDRDSKVLHAVTYNHIISLKPLARDWSRKLVAGSKNINFELDGYAQNNYIKLKENSMGTVERGLIQIDNDKLKLEATLFEIPSKTSAIISASLQSDEIANIDDIEVDENGVPTYDTNTAACVRYTEAGYGEDVEVAFEPGEQGTTVNLPIIMPLNMTDIVNIYYPGLVSILNNAKITEREFNLTDQDIEDYRSIKNGVPAAFIPVWVDDLGACFYINKIKNFVSGKPTKCELVKI